MEISDVFTSFGVNITMLHESLFNFLNYMDNGQFESTISLHNNDENATKSSVAKSFEHKKFIQIN